MYWCIYLCCVRAERERERKRDRKTGWSDLYFSSIRLQPGISTTWYNTTTPSNNAWTWGVNIAGLYLLCQIKLTNSLQHYSFYFSLFFSSFSFCSFSPSSSFFFFFFIYSSMENWPFLSTCKQASNYNAYGMFLTCFFQNLII